MPAGVLVPALSDVTLVAVTDVAIAATARALTLSQQQARFGQVLWLSPEPPPPGTRVTWRKVAPIRSRTGYSRFMMRDLAAHLATPHVLCVQWDGYVLDAAAWDPLFLHYDYIGAPWPHFADRQVGNGGFSLRSRRLVEACATLPIDPTEAEDVAICRTHRHTLEQRFGLRFAPVEVARRFAYERRPRDGAQFGFHGAFNMPDLVPPRELHEVFAALEPGLLSRREHREILRAALARGDLRLAWTIWQRLRRAQACG